MCLTQSYTGALTTHINVSLEALSNTHSHQLGPQTYTIIIYGYVFFTHPY